MRLALFSDVHGNLSGLEAVLTEIDREAVEMVVFVGDLCQMGPRPADCVRAVRERRLAAVRGNTDEWLVGAAAPPAHMASIAEWTRGQLAAGEIDYLARLPFGLRVSPSADPGDDLLIVHANPLDINGIIYPDEETQRARYGDVRQNDDQLAPLLGSFGGAALAYGHLHVPGRRTWRGKLLVNVSSVNMPGDGDPRAKYALLTWAGGRWAAEHRYVTYAVAPEIDAFRARRPPHWEEAVSELASTGVYFPQRI